MAQVGVVRGFLVHPEMNTPHQHLDTLEREYAKITREAAAIRLQIEQIKREQIIPFQQFIRSAK